MRIFRAFQMIAIAGSLGICSLPHCFASSTTTANAGSFEAMQLEESSREEDFKTWQREEQEEVFLVIAIGSFGIIIGACQSANNRWARGMTVALGVGVSIITLSMNTYYPADYQSLRRAVVKAKPMVARMRNQLKLYHDDMDPTAFQQLQVEFVSSTLKFDDISCSILGITADSCSEAKGSGGFSTGLPDSFLRTVNAQSNPDDPPWISLNEMSDSKGTVFVGVAKNASLEAARLASLDGAIGKAVDYYQRHHAEASSYFYRAQLISIAKQLGVVSDTWTRLDSPGLYGYYTKFYVSNKMNLINLVPFRGALDAYMSSPEPWDNKYVHDSLGVHIEKQYYCFGVNIINRTGRVVTLISLEVKLPDKILEGDSRAEVYARAAHLATKAHKKTIDSLILSDSNQTPNSSTETRAIFVRKSVLGSSDPRTIQSIRIKYRDDIGQQFSVDVPSSRLLSP